MLRNDGSTLFVVSDRGLDCKSYNETYTSVTWENCTLRSWLNNSFYYTAFSSQEQGAIVSQNVLNEDNPDYGTEGGNNTNDKVYLLSIGETVNPSYGFCEDYYIHSASRRIKTSDYAFARGANFNYSVNDVYYGGTGQWCLRSPGDSASDVACVSYSGFSYRRGVIVDQLSDAVVPALHINLSSDFWSLADDGSSGEGGGSDDTGEIRNVKIAILRLKPDR